MKFQGLTVLAIAMACTTGGCDPRGQDTMSPPNRTVVSGPGVIGSWTGKVSARAPKPPFGGSSHYLNEKLGGFTMTIKPDRSFEADWRGLTKKGTWTLTGKSLKLMPTEILGRTQSDKSIDPKLFEQDNEMDYDQVKGTLTLRPKDDRSDTLLFSKPQ